MARYFFIALFTACAAVDVDWVAQFASEDKTLHVHPSDPALALHWTGDHNVVRVDNVTAWEACDLSGAEPLGDASPVVARRADHPSGARRRRGTDASGRLSAAARAGGASSKIQSDAAPAGRPENVAAAPRPASGRADRPAATPRRIAPAKRRARGSSGKRRGGTAAVAARPAAPPPPANRRRSCRPCPAA